MSRPVVDTLRSMPEHDRFVRGMVSWVGFKQIALPYKRAERFAGQSKYPLRKMLRFATDGILSFSTKPLQMSVGLGMLCAALALAAFSMHWVYVFLQVTGLKGWTALMIAVLFLGGIQLICVGILGEYVGRIYHEVKNRPLMLFKNALDLIKMAQKYPKFGCKPNMTV